MCSNDRESKPPFGQVPDRLNVADYDCDEYRSGDLLSDLMHATSHEIGNPLTSIISLATIIERIASEKIDSSSLVEDRIAPDLSKVKNYANSILGEAWRISSILQNVVAILSNRPFLSSTADVELSLRQSMQRLRKTLPCELLSVEFSLDEKCREVAIESDQLKVLLIDMLRKAYIVARGKIPDSMEVIIAKNEEPLVVKLDVTDVGSSVEISVSFVCKKRFERSDSSILSFRPISGAQELGKKFLALELAACWAIVERFNGSMRVEEFKLPDGHMIVMKALLPKPPQSREEIQGASCLPEPLRILLVNTDEMVTSAIRQILMLSFNGFNTVECARFSWNDFIYSSEARQDYDVVICDIGNGNSEELGDYLSYLQHETETMSRLGFLSDGEVSDDMTALKRPVIRKPFDIDELCSFVLSLC